MNNIEQEIKFKKQNPNANELKKLTSDTLKYSYGAEKQYSRDIYLLKMMTK